MPTTRRRIKRTRTGFADFSAPEICAILDIPAVWNVNDPENRSANWRLLALEAGQGRPPRLPELLDAWRALTPSARRRIEATVRS